MRLGVGGPLSHNFRDGARLRPVWTSIRPKSGGVRHRAHAETRDSRRLKCVMSSGGATAVACLLDHVMSQVNLSRLSFYCFCFAVYYWLTPKSVERFELLAIIITDGHGFATMGSLNLSWLPNYLMGSRKLCKKLLFKRFESLCPTLTARTNNFSTDSNYNYDLVVIGGGSGGLACAKEAASHGARVAVLDFVKPSPRGAKWGVGGTCVNVGCIPKKLMHHAALLGEAIHDARSFGWKVPEHIRMDWEVLREAVQNHVKSVNWVTRVQLKENKIDYVNGRGYFADPHTVMAVSSKGKETALSAKNIVVAVGGRPRYPNIPGAMELGISSDDVFSLERAPRDTLVIGGGYVGLECAGFLNGLGYSSSVMLRSVPLRGFDQQMANLVVSEMHSKGVKFLHQCIPTSLSREKSGKITVSWQASPNAKGGAGSGQGTFDTVLFAMGRRAVTDDLGLDKVGVATDPDSGKIIAHNEQSSVPHIYAVGDVLFNKPELTPVAVQAGRLLARRLFAGHDVQMDYDNVATTVFTPMEYGCVGLSETAAITKFSADDIDVYHAFYKPTEFSVPQRDTSNCYLKVVCKRNEPRTVIGMHFVGPNAGEVIQGFAVAIMCRVTVDQLMSTVGIHPTTAEEFTRIYITKRSGLDPSVQACCS